MREGKVSQQHCSVFVQSKPATSKTQIHLRVYSRERRSWNDDFALMSFPSQERQTKSSYECLFTYFLSSLFTKRHFIKKRMAINLLHFRHSYWGNKALRTVLKNWVWGTFAKFTVIFVRISSDTDIVQL